MIDPKKYEAIDPLALIVPPSIYPKLIEGKFPHIPKVEVIQKVTRNLSKTEKLAILSRARAMKAAAQAIEEAMS